VTEVGRAAKINPLTTRTLFLVLFAGLLAAHLCHSGVLWAEEDLPVAAAQQIIFGKTLYRDIWFDKPPLVPLIYLLWGARTGVILRIAGALYCALAAWLAFAIARGLWSEREGRWAAILMAFFLTFDTPSAVLPLAADSLLIAPHLLGILLAIQGRPVWSGIAAGVGFLFNAKALFVLAACAVFAGASAPWVAVGFLVPGAFAAANLRVSGAWQPYIDQVWVWPSAYARNTFVDRPVINGLIRTANWSGFHLALWIPAGRAFAGGLEARRKLQLAAWGVLSLGGVAIGWRFFPRYYFQILPFAVIVASRGMTLLGRRWWLPAILLLAPLVRFGPRYVMLAANADAQWSDLAMDRESRQAADVLNRLGGPGHTLFVWGYRPDVFVYTGMPAASKYLDCQAMTGVPADRHLTQSEPVLPPATTAAARRELAASQPSFIADGLSEYNPRLALASYPELKHWLAQYQEVARVHGMVIYRRRPL
jgi:hypothetical protein